MNEFSLRGLFLFLIKFIQVILVHKISWVITSVNWEMGAFLRMRKRCLVLNTGLEGTKFEGEDVEE